MRVLFFFIITFALVSCQSSSPSGNEIVFGDVIGQYVGECAEYDSSTAEIMNREDATLSVFASSISSAGIKTSCDRIMDQDLSVTSASASQIVFEQNQGGVQMVMTYFAAADSIAIIQNQDGTAKDLIFVGVRN